VTYTLQHPWWLLLWLVLPVLALWRARGGAAAVRFSALSLVSGGASVRVALAWLPAALEILGLAALVVALARPQLTHRETVVESEGIDILLALDVSGSMESPDFELRGREASRLDVAKAVMARFVEGRPDDRIGLVVFGEEAFTQVPLTLDHDALLDFLDNVRIGMAGRRATAIGQGLAIAARPLARLEAPERIIVLLTDGRSNAGKLEPLEAAEAAAAVGIRVYTIGVGAVGGSNGGLFGVFTRGRDEVDEATLKSVAEATDGRYFRATDTETLVQIYDTIDELEKSTAEVTEYIHREELFRFALVPGLALLGLQLLLAHTVFRRLP